DSVGARSPRHRAQFIRLSPQPERIDHRTVLRARSDKGRGARLFRTASLASRQPATAEGVGERPLGLEPVGPRPARRNDEVTTSWSSWPGLSLQVGFPRLAALFHGGVGQARLAALFPAEVGQARLPMPPTSSTLQSFKDVDARHKAGHDDEAQSFHVMAGLVPAIHALLVAMP